MTSWEQLDTTIGFFNDKGELMTTVGIDEIVEFFIINKGLEEVE